MTQQMPNVAISQPPYLAGQVLVSLLFNLSQENSTFPHNHRLTFLLQSFGPQLSHVFVVLVTEKSGAVFGKNTTFANLRLESKGLGSLLLKSPSKVKSEYS